MEKQCRCYILLLRVCYYFFKLMFVCVKQMHLTSFKALLSTSKGKPLVRSGNTIYYGNMNDPYVIMLQINSTKNQYDMDMAEKVSIQLLATDMDLRPKERIIRKSEKVGLYNALDIGAVWLERALAGK